MSAQVTTVLSPADSATAGGQHHTTLRADLLNNLTFPVAKPLLPFNIKDPGDVCAAAFLDDMVRIKKRTT